MMKIKAKSLAKGIVLCAGVFLVQGCETMPTNLSGILGTGEQASSKACNRPSATIVIADFENRTRTYASSANSGLPVKLGSELLKTGCFTIADRGRIQEIMQEQGLGQSGLARPSTVARIGRMTGADLIVFGSITQYSQEKPRDRDSKIEESVRIEANITMTGVESGNILLSETVSGSSFKIESSNALLSIIQTQSTSDKAVDQMLDEAVEAIVASLPSSFTGRSMAKPKKPKDPDALLAQRVMKEVGTYDGAIDGDIGPMSKAGIRAFQEQFDLSVTGILDEETLDLMRTMAN